MRLELAVNVGCQGFTISISGQQRPNIGSNEVVSSSGKISLKQEPMHWLNALENGLRPRHFRAILGNQRSISLGYLSKTEI